MRFARRLGVAGPFAAVGAFSFGIGTYLLDHFRVGHLSHIQPMCLAPWAMLLVWNALDAREGPWWRYARRRRSRHRFPGARRWHERVSLHDRRARSPDRDSGRAAPSPLDLPAGWRRSDHRRLFRGDGGGTDAADASLTSRSLGAAKASSLEQSSAPSTKLGTRFRRSPRLSSCASGWPLSSPEEASGAPRSGWHPS